MVRIYFQKRYTKKACPMPVVEKAQHYLGGFGVFNKSKVIHSTAVWMNPRDQNLYQININDESPKCAQDFWVLNFLRTYADCIITTGNILRKEPQAFDPRLLKPLKLPPNIYFGKQKDGTYKGKPLAILTA